MGPNSAKAPLTSKAAYICRWNGEPELVGPTIQYNTCCQASLAWSCFEAHHERGGRRGGPRIARGAPPPAAAPPLRTPPWGTPCRLWAACTAAAVFLMVSPDQSVGYQYRSREMYNEIKIQNQNKSRAPADEPDTGDILIGPPILTLISKCIASS